LKDIVRRYERSLQHLPNLLEISDYMIVFDNSKNFMKLLESNKEEILIEKSIPPWLKNAIES